MSTNHDSKLDAKLDAELDRHIDALRAEPIPDDAPSQELIARTAAMTRQSQAANKVPGRSFAGRIVTMVYAHRIAAVLILAIGAAAMHFTIGLLNSFGPQVAMADVAKQLSSAHTLSMITTVQGTTSPPVNISMKMFFKDPDHVRTEWQDSKTVMIMSGRKSLILNGQDHTAKLQEIQGDVLTMQTGAAAQSQNVVESIRNLGGAPGEPIGKKTIDGVECVGFHATNRGQDVNVWADAKTSEPVRIELHSSMVGSAMTIVMDHLQIDPKLDDAIFSLDPPAGYKIETQTVEVPKMQQIETDIIGLLEECAKANNDVFPAKFPDWQAMGQREGQRNPSPDAIKALATKAGMVSAILFSVPNGYVGQDVKLGEKDKIVFWFKPGPEYRAIFGDLHVENVAQDRVPQRSGK